MAVVVGPSNYVEPYTGVPKPAPLHVDVNGGLILGAGAVAALLGSVRIQDGVGAFLGTVSNGDPGDAAAHNNGLKVDASLQGYNGATWDRLRTAQGISGLLSTTPGTLAAALTMIDNNAATWQIAGRAARDAETAALLGAAGMVYNGASHDRARSASAANLGATSGLGAALVSEPGEWSLYNAPVANVQATATRAAVAGTRHILKSVTASFVGLAAAVGTRVTILVRDGLSGVGTPIWSRDMVITGALTEAAPVQMPGLHIVGTAGNAMTVEFVAAGGANTVETVSASGYDAS